MYRSYSSIETLERRSGGTGTNILLIPSSSNNLSAQLDRPVGTRHHYCTRISLKKTRSKGSGRRDVGLRRLVYRVFHRISRRVSTENGEWKRNKVLARTKSERDRCIIPVLLTAPPQSRSPALSSLFIPPSSAAPSKHTQQPLWVSFHPLWLCRLRPTATPAPPTFLSPSTFPSRANPGRNSAIFFLRFSSRVYSIRRPRKSEKRGGEMEIREGITRVYRRKAVKRILFLPDLLHFRIRDDVSLWRGRRSVPNPEISVRSGPIVAESFYEYRRVVHRVYVPFDSMRVVLQFSDKFSVVIGSIVGVAYGTTGNN